MTAVYTLVCPTCGAGWLTTRPVERHSCGRECTLPYTKADRALKLRLGIIRP